MLRTWSRAHPAAAIAIAAGAAATVAMWSMFALPVLDGARFKPHADHYFYLVAHAVGGTLMLTLGAAALFIGLTKQYFRYHRWVGGLYLAGGALGAGMGLYFSIAAPHPLPGIGFATGTLAVAWFAAAAMAYRAARNKRFESHRDWMIRSYVLSWTFVACRLVMSAPFAAKVDGPTTVAIIWMAWIAPVIVCELALQWRAGARN